MGSWGSVVIFHRRFACFSLIFRSPFSIQGFAKLIKSTLLRYYLTPSCLFRSPKPIPKMLNIYEYPYNYYRHRYDF